MKRMKILFGNRRMMVLATLAVLVLAAAALIASSASFNSTSTNPDNLFTAGNLHHINGNPGGTILTVPSKMKPGDSSSGTVTINNDGDIQSSSFTLTQSNVTPGAGSPTFAHYLLLTVTDQTSNTVLYGPASLDSLGTINLSIPLGSTHTFKFDVLFPNNATAGYENQYRGSTAGCDFDWTQTQ